MISGHVAGAERQAVAVGDGVPDADGIRQAPRRSAAAGLGLGKRPLRQPGGLDPRRWLRATSPRSRPTNVRCEFGDQSPPHPVEPAGTPRRREQPVHVASRRRLGLSPRCPVLPHPVSNCLALLLRHRALPLGDHLERLLLAAPGGCRGIRPFYRLDRTLYRDELSPERFLLILQGVQNSAFRHRDPASLNATRDTIAPVPDPYAHPRPPPAAALSVRRIRVAVGAQLRTPSQPRPPPGSTRPPHASGRPSTPATRAGRGTPARRHAAASGEPYRSHNARNRIVVSTDGSASS